MTTDNLHHGIPAELQDEFIEVLAKSSTVRIERIVSQGQSSPATGWYDQPWHEWVVLVEGEAELEIRGQGKIRLGRGDHISLPAHTLHKVCWTPSDRRTVWLAVHYQ